MATTLPAPAPATAVVRTGDRQPRRRRTTAKRPRLATIILILGALYCLIPVAWVVIASSKSPRELFTSFSFAPGTGCSTTSPTSAPMAAGSSGCGR
ncbi:hypothetical protein MAFF212519_28690 [Clavibacter michiganensis]